jgi:hypothetical protein
MKQLGLALVVLGMSASAASAETLHGRVFDSMEELIYPGVTLTLVREEPLTVTTDEVGAFRFEDVAPGPYFVEIDLGEHGRVLARAVVHEGRPTLQHFDISKILNPHEDHGY